MIIVCSLYCARYGTNNDQLILYTLCLFFQIELNLIVSCLTKAKFKLSSRAKEFMFIKRGGEVAAEVLEQMEPEMESSFNRFTLASTLLSFHWHWIYPELYHRPVFVRWYRFFTGFTLVFELVLAARIMMAVLSDYCDEMLKTQLVESLCIQILTMIVTLPIVCLGKYRV
jgi:hypothetical protein